MSIRDDIAEIRARIAIKLTPSPDLGRDRSASGRDSALVSKLQGKRRKPKNLNFRKKSKK